MGGGLMMLVNHGIPDVYLPPHIHQCFICTGKHCCEETPNIQYKIFYCEKCTHSLKIELNLCGQDQIPTELTNLLLENIMSLTSNCY